VVDEPPVTLDTEEGLFEWLFPCCTLSCYRMSLFAVFLILTAKVISLHLFGPRVS